VVIVALRRPVVVLAAAVTLTLTLAACGGGATPSPIVTAAPTAARTVTPPTVEPSATPEPSAEVTIYVVKSGDTMYGIAKELGITLKALQAANPQVTDPRTMQVGEELVIPAP
jgi:LysM repeat protein